MVLEHEQIVGEPELMQAVEHNLRLSGDTNRAIKLKDLILVPGMKLWRAYDEQEWEVVKISPENRILVKHETPSGEHKTHYEAWGRNHRVRIPQGVLNGKTR